MFLTRTKSILMFFKMKYLPYYFYLIVGLTLFFILILVFNSHVLHLKIESAVVSSPIESLVSPMGGYINVIYVGPGEEVKRGQPLVKIKNVELEKDLQLAYLQIDEAMLTLNYYRSLLANEHERLNVYKHIGENRLVSAQARVDLTRQALLSAKKNIMRMKQLHNKHYLSDANWDLSDIAYHRAKEQMKNAVARRNLEYHSLHSIGQGMYFTGNKVEGKTHDLAAEVNAGERRLEAAKKRVAIYQSILKNLTLVAPYDGKILQVFKSSGSTVDNIKPLLLIEKANPDKKIIAYLTQNEITALSLSTPVKIIIPALNKTFTGKIASINRTAAFVDEMNAQYRFRDMYADRTAMVMIDLNGAASIQQSVLSGMPAIVYFKRKLGIF